MSHTPGPWVIRGMPLHSKYIGPADDGGMPSLAVVPASVSRDPEEQAANARLIAAAPALLLALRQMLNQHPGTENTVTRAAREALSIATGE